MASTTTCGRLDACPRIGSLIVASLLTPNEIPCTTKKGLVRSPDDTIRYWYLYRKHNSKRNSQNSNRLTATDSITQLSNLLERRKMLSRSTPILLLGLLACLISPAAPAAITIAAPHVSIYMLCRTNDWNETSTELGVEMQDYYRDLLPDTATDVRLDVSYTVEACVATDIQEVEISSDGFLDVSSGSDADADLLTPDELQDLVTSKNLETYWEDVCDQILAFEVKVQESNTTDTENEGWTVKWSSRFCDLNTGGVDMSAGTILVISLGTLVLVCLLGLCFCRRCCRSGK
jgi:hypothetical protein